MKLLKLLGKILALVLIWGVNFAVVTVLLHDVVRCVFLYKEHIDKIEEDFQPYEFAREGESIRKLEKGDAVLFCDMNGNVEAPRLVRYVLPPGSPLFMFDAGYRPGGRVYFVADKRCSSKRLNAQIESLLWRNNQSRLVTITNVFVVGRLQDAGTEWACEAWGKNGLKCRGEAVDLSPIRTVLYAHPYYISFLCEFVVDFINGDFRDHDIS